MKTKEQTRKLAAGCSKHCFEVVDGTDVVSSKHCFEVVDRTDVVSSKHCFEVVEATNNLIKLIKRNAFGFRNFENFKKRIFIALNIKKERTKFVLSRA
ncbi:chlorohydrolase [Streptococcus pneumoniae]|nr:chlorohydrolase [Streptococcus pneumoniae]